jgi:putative spermidine/putrescine transport system permease protein
MSGSSSSSRRRSPLLFGLTLAVSLFTVLPMVWSVLAGFLQNYAVGVSGGWTLRWLGEVWAQYGDTFWCSLALAALCVLCTLVLGVPCAYAVARSRSRWVRLFEELLTLPVAVPGLASALALLLCFGAWPGFRQSLAFILVGHVVFTLPFMVRTVAASFARPELRSLEEAARTLGAGFAQRFLHVLVPAVLPAMAAASLMVFTLSIGEFNLTWMLHTPLTRTLPVGLADSYASMRLEVGSAYTLLFFAATLPALWALQALAHHLQHRHESH